MAKRTPGPSMSAAMRSWRENPDPAIGQFLSRLNELAGPDSEFCRWAGLFVDYLESLELPLTTHDALGLDYEAASWLTQDQADRMARILGLKPGVHLLDIGAGAGWPSLYFAKKSGCDLSLADPSPDNIAKARLRAQSDEIAGSWRADIADGAALPYADDSFDAISHADVLCCLDAKQEVLNECRRVAKANCKMSFSVISISPDLNDKAHARALANGPSLMHSVKSYPDMLKSAGWQIIDLQNLTHEFLAATHRQLQIGDGNAEKWKSRISAIEDGLIRRELYSATPDGL